MPSQNKEAKSSRQRQTDDKIKVAAAKAAAGKGPKKKVKEILVKFPQPVGDLINKGRSQGFVTYQENPGLS